MDNKQNQEVNVNINRSKGPSNGLATAGLTLGIIAVVGSWIPIINIVSLILAIIALPLAGVGLSKASKIEVGKGQAIAGIVLSIVTFIFFILSILATAEVIEDIDEAIQTSSKQSQVETVEL